MKTQYDFGSSSGINADIPFSQAPLGMDRTEVRDFAREPTAELSVVSLD